jgi:hypothetical protein
MTTPTYAGNAANYPAVVRLLPDGNDLNQTELAKTTEDLADRTAFLHAKHRRGTLLEMAAITDASERDVCITPSGVFVYSPSLGPGPSPFVVVATGMGAGWWIDTNWLSLMDSSDPPKISPVYLRYMPNGNLSTAAKVNFAIHYADYQQVIDTGSDSLGVTISNLLTTDVLNVTVGPLQVLCVDGDHVFVEVQIHQGSTYTNYKQDVSPPSGVSLLQPLFWNIKYFSLAVGSLTVAVLAKNDNSHTSTLKTPAAGEESWGPAGGYIWGHYSVQRGA